MKYENKNIEIQNKIRCSIIRYKPTYFLFVKVLELYRETSTLKYLDYEMIHSYKNTAFQTDFLFEEKET